MEMGLPLSMDLNEQMTKTRIISVGKELPRYSRSTGEIIPYIRE